MKNFTKIYYTLLIILAFAISLSCSKDEEILVPKFEMSLDGESFDPAERYSLINTYAGEKLVDGNLKKIFILYLQINEGEPRLDVQHFALYLLDSNADDDGEAVGAVDVLLVSHLTNNSGYEAPLLICNNV